MAHASPTTDRYHPQMPSIPGVPSGRRGRLGAFFKTGLGGVLLGALGLLIVGGLALGIRHMTRAGNTAAPALAVQHTEQRAAAPAVAPPPPADPIPSEVGEIAPLSELAKPWSSKVFTFVRPLTHESFPAMVVRLPGTAAGKSGAYWAFSTTEPFGTCQLLYVTNIDLLASQYGFKAQHPMVVDPCTQTVFDPLRMGQRGDGAWVRGEIVQGGGLRPPIAIELSVRGDSLYALRME
jgi:hypothetical protein